MSLHEDIEAIPLAEVAPGATNVPVMRFQRGEDFAPVSDLGALRYEEPFATKLPLESLVVNQGSDTLVVALHGAMTADKHHLPRFEWLRTLSATPYSAMYFSDPTLRLTNDLLLSWYMGLRDHNLYPLLAERIRTVQEALGAKQVVLIGSSGGGFASLQVSSHLPGSVAVAFNPQTDLNRYLVSGSRKVQRRFIELVMPHLAPSGIEALPAEGDWFGDLGDRASVLRRYRTKRNNRVLLVQNRLNVHHLEEHYAPFIDLVARTQEPGHTRVKLYDGPDGHKPPAPREFIAMLSDAVKWISGISGDLESEEVQPTGGAEVQNMAAEVVQDLLDEVRALRRERDEVLDQVKELRETINRLGRRMTRIPFETANWTSPLNELSKLSDGVTASQAITSFTLRPQDAVQVVHHVSTAKPELVVECGSGMSSVWIGHAIRGNGSGRLISLEHDPAYFHQTLRLLERNGLTEIVDLRLAELKEYPDGSGQLWYDTAVLQDLQDIDLLLVDGPPAATGDQARYPAMPFFGNRMSDGGVVVLDDTDREDEQRVLRRWEESFRLESLLGGEPSRDQRASMLRFTGRR